MAKEILYIGCYTPEENAGIQVIEFDNETGKLNLINELLNIQNSSFLAISNDKKQLLAVSENEPTGELALFNISNPKAPILINKQSTLGGSPCHISLTNNNAFVSNYGSGDLSAFSFNNSKLFPTYTQVQHYGQGGNLDRQASAHTHSSQASPDKQFLVVADLGIDMLKVYHINAQQLQLTASQKIKAGAGPRHLSFNKEGDKLYLANELNNQVMLFAFNKETGQLTELQSICSLAKHQTDSYIAELQLSQDGSFLYVSNRGDDSITIFAVCNETGKLTRLAICKTQGKFPRHFSLSPDQNWLLVAHQNSPQLTVFKRDPKTGLLILHNKNHNVKHAVCITFLN